MRPLRAPERIQPPADAVTPALRLTSALQAVSSLAVLVVLVLLAWHPLEDLDIWFHHRAGTDLTAAGPLPPFNQYSFTEPRHPWLNHEWLFQLLVHPGGPRGPLPAFDAAGWNLLRTCLAALVGLALLAGDGGLRRLRGQGNPAAAGAAGLVLLAALGLLWPRLLLRPELLSFLALVLVVRWTEAWRLDLERDGQAATGLRRHFDPRTPAGRTWWLVVVWTQCHGFAAAAPLVVLVGLLGWAPGRAPTRPTAAAWRAAGLALPALLLALMLTPNGWQGLALPWRALAQFRGEGADLRRTVAELAPLLRSPGMLAGTITLFEASLAAGVLLVASGWRRLGLLRIVLWLALAAAALASQRALGPYALAFALLGLGWAPPASWAPRGKLEKPLALGLTLATLAAALAWAPAITSDRFYLAEGVARRHGDGLATALYPVQCAAALADTPPARVFANLGASGLLLGTTRSTLYIDGRTEAYSPALWREYLEIRRGGDHALALLDARQVEAICLAGTTGSFSGLLQDLLASHRWQVDAAEGAGVLLRRGHLAPGPDSAPARAAAGQAVLAAAAAAQSRAAAGLSPARAADALVAAAALHRLAGDAPSALTCLQDAVARAPRHAQAQHNLGNLLLAEGRHDQALARFEAAARANRRLAAPCLNAGVCLMRLGRPADAARSFAQAARRDPDAVEAWANLAIARQAAGDAEGALTAVQRALELAPGDARLKSLRDGLRRGGAQ